jgi:hypothetical protein
LGKGAFVLVVVFIAALSAAFAADAVGINTNLPDPPSPEIPFTDRDVVVFADHDFFLRVKDDLSAMTSKVREGSDLKEVISGEVAVINEQWIYCNEPKKIDGDIEAAVKNKIILIFVGDDLHWYKESSVGLEYGSYVENMKENVCCIYFNKIPYSCSITNDDEKQAIQWAYSWADEILSEDSTGPKCRYDVFTAPLI